MKITVQNTADIANKHIRRLKWYLYQLSEKFSHLIYAVVHIKQEGVTTPTYEVSMQLGISGPDIIIKNRSTDINELVSRCYKDAFRYIRKRKPSDY